MRKKKPKPIKRKIRLRSHAPGSVQITLWVPERVRKTLNKLRSLANVAIPESGYQGQAEVLDLALSVLASWVGEEPLDYRRVVTGEVECWGGNRVDLVQLANEIKRERERDQDEPGL